MDSKIHSRLLDLMIEDPFLQGIIIRISRPQRFRDFVDQASSLWASFLTSEPCHCVTCLRQLAYVRRYVSLLDVSSVYVSPCVITYVCPFSFPCPMCARGSHCYRHASFRLSVGRGQGSGSEPYSWLAYRVVYATLLFTHYRCYRVVDNITTYYYTYTYVCV